MDKVMKYKDRADHTGRKMEEPIKDTEDGDRADHEGVEQKSH